MYIPVHTTAYPHPALLLNTLLPTHTHMNIGSVLHTFAHLETLMCACMIWCAVSVWGCRLMYWSQHDSEAQPLVIEGQNSYIKW